MFWGGAGAVVARTEEGDPTIAAGSVGTADRLLKRAVDLAVAGVLLILLSPLLLLVAAAVVLDSGAPVFYRCRRVGRGGGELRMLKFRKMARDAAGPPLTVASDPRFTRVGRLLARTKLDELPQLWHVVRGEMSLVGPRPEDPSFVRLHPEAYAEILRVRPGITGLSQLAFVNEAALIDTGDPGLAYVSSVLPQKLTLDRLYARHHSLGMDLHVLRWTALAILLRRPVAVHRDDGSLSARRRPDAGLVAAGGLKG